MFNQAVFVGRLTKIPTLKTNKNGNKKRNRSIKSKNC